MWTEAENGKRSRRHAERSGGLINRINDGRGALLGIEEFSTAVHQHRRSDFAGTQANRGNSSGGGSIRGRNQSAVNPTCGNPPAVEEEETPRIDSDASAANLRVAGRAWSA